MTVSRLPTVVCIGSGSMASLFAARLAMPRAIAATGRQQPASDVWLLTSERPHTRHVQQHGLQCQPLKPPAPTQPLKVNVAYTLPQLLSSTPTIDLVILYIKATNNSVERAAEQIAKILQQHPQCVAVDLLNGVGHHDILCSRFADASDRHRVLIGSTSSSATLPAVGLVQETGSSPITIISNDETLQAGQQDVHVERAALVLRGGEFDVVTAEYARKDTIVYTKLLYNITINTLGCLLNVRNKELMTPVHRPLFVALIAEYLQVMRAMQIQLDIPDVNQHATTEDAVLAAVYRICERTATNINSTLSDLLQHRPTENHMLLGTVVRAAAKHQISVPTITACYHIIEAKQSHYGKELPVTAH